MNQLQGVKHNNNSSQSGYYVNRQNLLSEHANFTGNRVPVSVPNRNKMYTESVQPNMIPNRNPVYRGVEQNVAVIPSSRVGNLRSSHFSYPVTSSATTLIRSHELTNLEEIARNQVPKRNCMVTLQTSTAGRTSINANINISKPQKTEDTSGIKPFGSSPGEKLCIFTGTVEKLIEWNKILTHNLCYYEVIATMVSLKEGSIRTQKIMLLKNIIGPILQVVYYTVTHIDLDDFHLGKTVRCVGYMTGHNIFNAFSIRGATQEEIDNLQRFTLISDKAITLQLKK